MRRILFFMLACVAASVSVSCVDEVSDPSVFMQELTFSASCQSETKTALVEGNEVYWLPGDQIAVSGASDPFVTDIAAPSGFTQFTGAASPASEYYAVYPYASLKSWDGSTATVEIPQIQTAVKGTFADDLNISVASTSSEDMLFRFHNVLGYVKFTVSEQSGSIKSVTVSAIGDEPLAGDVQVDCSSDSPSASSVENSESYVTLTSGTVLESGNYYIAMLPGTYASGLEFTFMNDKGQVATKQIARELTLSAGQIRNIGEMKGLEFEEVTIDPTQIPDNEIWYTTTDGKPISLQNNDYANNGFPDSHFNVNVISNEYLNGFGRIIFDSSVSEIHQYSFALKPTLLSIYLPSTVNLIEAGAFYNSYNLETICLNTSSLTIDYEFDFQNPFRACHNLFRFVGQFASKDGRCLVIDQELYGFAPSGLLEYSLPQDIKTIKKGAFSLGELKSIVVTEGVENIEEGAFTPYNYSEDVTSLEYVSLPSSLKEMHGYAFIRNKSIKSFDGNSKFVSADKKALIIPDYCDNYNTIVAFASGADVDEYTIPDGVHAIESYAFYYANKLKRLTFPDSFRTIFSGHAFEGTNNIESISGKYVNEDGRSLVIDNKLIFVAGSDLKSYTTPKGVTELGYMVLGFHDDLREIVLSDDVKTTDEYGYVFSYNPNLETITISARMLYLGYDPFYPSSYGTPSLKTVYCRALIPPVLFCNTDYVFENLSIYVPEESYGAYLSSVYWAPYKDYIKPYDFGDLSEFYPDYYISTDYSQDGKVMTLQTATVGNGIDVVLMGDAYSDREIADGSYASDMRYMYDNLFTQEPFKTHKSMFNVYYVNVVSMTEGYENAGAALGGYFGDGTLVGGNDNKCFEYALNAITEDEMDEALIIVAMNSDAYAGTCYMYYPESATGTYGNGPSVAYFPKGDNEETFAQLLHHEANGHGFAKLADEYAYEDMGAVPSDYMTETRNQQSNWGWWKNVDFTSDPEQVRWSYFLEDERYANEGLGVFEGGLTYWSGVWRPTEDSIMRYNTGGFNAPSREAIYYRIHKLAYGDSWEYDYEDFVEYDKVNRSTSASAPQKTRRNYVERPLEPTAAPVVVGKSWRDAR